MHATFETIIGKLTTVLIEAGVELTQEETVMIDDLMGVLDIHQTNVTCVIDDGTLVLDILLSVEQSEKHNEICEALLDLAVKDDFKIENSLIEGKTNFTLTKTRLTSKPDATAKTEPEQKEKNSEPEPEKKAEKTESVKPINPLSSKPVKEFQIAAALKTGVLVGTFLMGTAALFKAFKD